MLSICLLDFSFGAPCIQKQMWGHLVIGFNIVYSSSVNTGGAIKVRNILHKMMYVFHKHTTMISRQTHSSGSRQRKKKSKCSSMNSSV